MSQKLVSQLESARDKKSAQKLATIQADEVTHVGAGLKWFKKVAERQGVDPIPKFHTIVRKHFKGSLRPPFNTELRAQAGFTFEWYVPLVHEQWAGQLSDDEKKVYAAAQTQAPATATTAPASSSASASAAPAATTTTPAASDKSDSSKPAEASAVAL